MRKASCRISLTVVTSLLISSAANAKCDFSTGITPGQGKTYVYSEECHQQVGSLVEQNKVKDQQIADYTKAISLKDLALKEADGRAQKWNDTSTKLEDRLQKVDSLEKKNDWMYFGLGVLTTFFAGWAAAKFYGK